METCTELYFLSTLACQLFQCMEEDEIEILASNLLLLSHMLERMLVGSH
ncbi:MAG: hypothetical protein HFI74_01480 [Lachnospiraceae bacterium]|jgi:hypothetical protein|nr:hypothetical protein [Lachnospiraceae bacterium]